MNTDELEWALSKAERRVLEIQAKLHRWATENSQRRFNDLFNLVSDPAFLLVAWARVRSNRGARTAGVDGKTAYSIELVQGVDNFLDGVRASLKERSFQPVPVRERVIPKAGGEKRSLGIPTVRDRVVQASLKLVMEPIFEADFLPCFYGFRPGRRAHDAIAETRMITSNTYEWVVEGDITACFDEISHTVLMDRVRNRIGDKRVLGLVKALLKSGVLGQDGAERHPESGTPQGGILSPLLANIALSVLDECIAQHPGGPNVTHSVRSGRRRRGQASYRLIRYADDFLVLVAGSREHAEGMKAEVAEALSLMGLRLSAEKTRITHLDEGFDFLGWRIQRHRKKGTNRQYVYTYPARKALSAAMAKVKTICRRMDLSQPLDALLRQLNPALKGWCEYFRFGVSSATFQYLSDYVWKRVVRWLYRKHSGFRWKDFRRRYCAGGMWPASERRALFDPGKVRTARYRYRYRGAAIPNPWQTIA